MRAVLISIHPEWCKLIASGKKTIEVRKTRPKLETPFKCYIYCTGQNRRSDAFNLEITYEEMLRDMAKNGMKCMSKYGNGKVWAEFVCDHIFQYTTTDIKDQTDIEDQEMQTLSCMSHAELAKYENSSFRPDSMFDRIGLFGWHITELKVFDSPLPELAEFRHIGERYHFHPWVTRPPQSWCYVEVRE